MFVYRWSLCVCILFQITCQFFMDFNLFRSFHLQKSHSSSESKVSKLPGIKYKEFDQPTTSASDSTTTETEDVPTAAMESAATQTSSTESSRNYKSNPDLVLDDNLPPADGDDCKSVCVCKFENRIDNQFCSAMFSSFLALLEVSTMNCKDLHEPAVP